MGLSLFFVSGSVRIYNPIFVTICISHQSINSFELLDHLIPITFYNMSIEVPWNILILSFEVFYGKILLLKFHKFIYKTSKNFLII